MFKHPFRQSRCANDVKMSDMITIILKRPTGTAFCGYEDCWQEAKINAALSQVYVILVQSLRDRFYLRQMRGIVENPRKYL
jgi:hypothetical protein